VNKYTIVTFDSVHFALKSEATLESGEFDIALITTPRSVTSQCGFSLEVKESFEIVKSRLIELNLRYDSLYELSIVEGVKFYAKKS
jgi:hypothetical protein